MKEKKLRERVNIKRKQVPITKLKEKVPKFAILCSVSFLAEGE